MDERVIRIGGASGFWGDSSIAVPQLLAAGEVDYLVFDYLAEVTMSLLAAARMKDPSLGYATDFVRTVAENLPEIMRQGVRLVANAGGVNPQGCARALREAAAAQGIELSVAVVEGDDVMPLLPALKAEGVGGMQGGGPLPNGIVTANAYLGALPVKAALGTGAQVVVTGRCVDSAVTLGVLMHEFGWAEDDYDRLAQASMGGHIIECGCQATGGLFTDWRTVPDWENMGYPILECGADGGIVVTKPAGTGGLVSVATVGEQILYETGDPARYLLPDVICDYTSIQLRQVGADRVSMSNICGLAPPVTYKVSATYRDGYRSSAQLTIVGMEAVAKARRTGEAILARTRAAFRQKNIGDYSAASIEVLGGEANFGPHGKAEAAREAVLWLSVTHPDKRALEIFAREIAPAGTSYAPGTTGVFGRPQVTPAIKQFAFLLPKNRLEVTVSNGARSEKVEIPGGGQDVTPAGAQPTFDPLPDSDDLVEVPLIRIAHGRSGDKGDSSNIGLIARSVALLPWLRAEVTEARVKAYLGYLVKGEVVRFDVPGLMAVNFLCTEALGGGGMASLRNDPLGKGMAQILLTMPVRAPAHLLPAEA